MPTEQNLDIDPLIDDDDDDAPDAAQIPPAAATLEVSPEIAEQAQGLLHQVVSGGDVAPQQPPQQVAQAAVPPAPQAAAPPQQQPGTPDPLAALREQARNYPVSAEQIAAFKQANPGIAESGYSDQEIGDRLSMIMAWQATQARQQGQQQQQPRSPGAPEPRRYSLWNDIAGMPRAVASGIVKSGLETYDAVNEIVLQNEANHSQWRQGFERYYSNISGASSVAATVAQWGAAFVGIGKFAKLAGVARAATRTGQIGRAAAQGAGADFLAFDGHDARLSDLIQSNPILGNTLANPLNAYLASNKDDTEAEGRLKNALEGLGIGATVDVVLAGVRAMRARRAGDTAGAEAAQGDAIRRFNELNDAPRDDFSTTSVPPVARQADEAADAIASADATAGHPSQHRRVTDRKRPNPEAREHAPRSAVR